MVKIAPSQYLPETLIAPGETIREVLDARGMTQTELAVRMKQPANKVNQIINGKRQITVDTAIAIELVLGLPADFWTNLEKNYQLAQERAGQRVT